VIHLMTVPPDDHHHLHHGLSLRKALAYTECSRNTYYYYKKQKERKRPENARQQQEQTILEKKIEEIILQRPSYGTRRMAAMLTTVLGKSINRKRVRKIYHKLNLAIPSRKKREIIRSKYKNIKKVDRPNDVWEVDLTYVHCGIDGWGYLFNIFDIFTREWIGYCFDLSAVKENAIVSIENALVSHKEIVPDIDNDNNKSTIRADNGTQYTSNAFRKSMSVLGIKLEHIACNTPEQNGHIESFHKTLKKEYIWPYDFRAY